MYIDNRITMKVSPQAKAKWDELKKELKFRTHNEVINFITEFYKGNQNKK